MIKRWLALAFAITGLGLFGYVLQQTGLAVLWVEIGKLGAGWVLVLLISSTRYWSRAAAWLRCLNPVERTVGFWRLVRARLAGEAVGDLTFGPLVAEPLRLIALGDQLSTKAGIHSLAVENVAYTVTSCLVVLAGALTLLAGVGLSETLRGAVFTALLVVLALSLPALVVIARRWKVASQVLSALANWLVRQPVPREIVHKQLAQLSELEDYVFDFYARRPKDFLLVLVFETCFHLGGMLEIYVTLQLLGHNVSLATAFLLESLNRALNIAFIFVPALVGVDEFGTALVTEALGFGRPAGVALALIRKLRMFAWIGVGLAFLLSQAKAKSRQSPS